MAKNKKGQVAVIGGGPMGLAAAYYLLKKGYRPTIYEADSTLGGMAASFNFSGLNIERYYHFHCTSDKDLIDLLTELKIEKKLIWKRTKMGYWFQGKIQSWGTPLALLNFKGLNLFSKFRYALHVLYAVNFAKYNSLENIDAISWLKKWIGNNAYDILWKNLFMYKFYEYSHEISAAWICSRMKRIGKSRYNIFHEKLGYIEGGSSTLINAIEERLKFNNALIHLSAKVTSIKINNDSTYTVVSNNKKAKFSNVITTIPTPYISKIIDLLPSMIKNQFDSIKNIAVVCVVVKLKKSISQNFWINITDPEIDIPGLIEYSNLVKTKVPIVYIPFYMPQSNLRFNESDLFYKKIVIKYIKKINKNIQNKDFLDIKVNRYLYAQPICEPGHLSKIPPIMPYKKGLYIADTSYYYPEDRGISESIKFAKNLIDLHF